MLYWIFLVEGLSQISCDSNIQIIVATSIADLHDMFIFNEDNCDTGIELPAYIKISLSVT